ncbi:monosaccharide-transporting ATPase [Mesorhizobium sp. L-8-10]|uniref:ABC transporter permease n=1 Tax=Mesorhizobium sp. L-8-10 TaxID=2744523 RepID=UPI001925D1A3|nr:ABC transporter permease [Mesorhizobium sp. L-8-10]BCH29375.1 monosaccharide-transporting ATPase [Mesorhizobium sp. L-8-10]
MSATRRRLQDPTIRAFALLVVVLAIFVGLAASTGAKLSAATAFSIFQNFAVVGLVALGLGITMLIREFDLSVAGMFGLGGIVAVLVGNGHPVIGLATAVGIGLAGGLAQSFCMVRFGLGSVPITLGGLLTFNGIAVVISGNRSIPFTNLDLALWINTPLAGMFSIHSAITLLVFVVAALLISYTRPGRDVIATGSNARASRIAGINTNAVVMAVFATSGALAALGGGLLSFGLAAASPSGLTAVLIPAIAAVILGGGSLSGGTGLPLGIAAGVLILSLLRTGMTILGLPPHAHDIVTGLLLLSVAVLDGEALRQRVHEAVRTLKPLRRLPRG